MKIIGITGSIATGKTTVAKIFKENNIKVFNDDQIVHRILNSKRIINYLAPFFSSAIVDNKIDKKILRKIVCNDYVQLKLLEDILHPLVNHKRRQFMLKNKIRKEKLIVFDTPLLFEKNLMKQCDYTITTYCDYETQKQRALSRGTINEKEFNYLLSKQISSKQKIVLADFSINTEEPLEETKNKIINFINHIV